MPTFPGYTDRKSVADFLDDLSAYQTAMGIRDKDLVHRILPAALVDDTARWFRLQRRFTSLPNFQWRFRNELLLPDYEYRNLEELQRRTQHPEESLSQFLRALQELYR